MSDVLRYRPRLPMVKAAIEPSVPDLSPLQWQGSLFLENLRQLVKQTETSHECHAIYTLIAEAEEQIAGIATACMARENLLQMKGK